MNQDTIDDLKQFITATVLQGTTELSQRLDNLENKFDGLELKVNNLSKDVVIIKTDLHDLTQTVYAIADAHAETLEDHGRQLARLHSKTV